MEGREGEKEGRGEGRKEEGNQKYATSAQKRKSI